MMGMKTLQIDIYFVGLYFGGGLDSGLKQKFNN